MRDSNTAPPDSELMYCHEIGKGMIFTVPTVNPDGSIQSCRDWEVVSSEIWGVQIDNPRKNKWYCRPVGSENPPTLLCFDRVFEKKQWNFRLPTSHGKS